MSQPRRIDAVLDLETLGLAPTAPILEVGVVLVMEEGLSDLDFQGYVTLESALTHGKPDASTLLWWMSDEQAEARSQLVRGLSGKVRQPISLEYVLKGLDNWLERQGATHLWANGASFDLGALNHAYASTGIERKFDFRQERDLRTAFDLRWKPERDWKEGRVKHCALHDAQADAERLWEVLYGKSS